MIVKHEKYARKTTFDFLNFSFSCFIKAVVRHPGTIHMFIGQFFKQNPNFGVKRLTKAISRVQVNNENGNPRD